MKASRTINSVLLRAAFGCALSVSIGCSQQQFGITNKADAFSQKVTYSRTVDVLWVIDNSGSMAVHQNALASQVQGFVTALDQTGLDYQMAVTTMDLSASGEKGRFIAQAGTPVILNAGVPNVGAVLQSRLEIGDTGSSVERGLSAMKAALSAPLITTSNAGFLRDNSLLVVVFLSDENDNYSPNDDYGAFLDTIRPPLPLGDRSWVAQFMGLVPADPNCSSSNWQYSSVGTRFISLATESGGAAESICSGDLRSALTNVQERVLSVLTAYQLKESADEASITVNVNGVDVPKNATNGWTYDATTFEVRFHGTAIPKAGSSIIVHFNPATLG